ncbi:rod shape-determining protein RodA [Sporosarcina sp. resist]|uniref:rod shape-determining protein RodA n=1 Tax=Sporosarcina sp. resist TaxID=2762563 RepID=UPI00351C4040
MRESKAHIDYSLAYILFALFVFSLLAVYSGSGQYSVSDPYFYVKRQVIWYIIGASVMVAVARFDYDILERLAWPIYSLGIVFLVLVHFFGTNKNGSQRWLSFGLFDIQPSEFMKVGLIIFLAVMLKRKGEKKLTFKESIPIMLKLVIASMIPFYLVLVQPDLGSALVIAAVLFTLLISSGISYRLIGLLFTGFSVFIGMLVWMHNHFFDNFIKIIKPHQLDRIYGWLNPHEFIASYSYQLTQAMLGIGSGQMFGSGFNQGTQVQSGRIPEAHTDFIFSVVGEESGFAGGAFLIGLYFLLIYRMIIVAISAENLLGVYIVAGSIGLISFQVFQNIGMTIGLMPVTGLALPFISYGGSALLTNMIVMGLVLSIQLRSKKFLFLRQ